MERKISAGEAFAKAAQNDPATAAALARIREKIPERLERLRANIEALQRRYKEAGFDAPQNLDDHLRIAAIIGVNPDPMTAGELLTAAEQWVADKEIEIAREKVIERIRAKVAQQDDPLWTIKKFREVVGWQNDITWRKRKSEGQLPSGDAFRLSFWRKWTAAKWPRVAEKLPS